ncbi:MAG: DNA primase [Gammaproteobacteria bacterium]|nr:MAG: DNA primase [Gammaproteobacteria bacterium]
MAGRIAQSFIDELLSRIDIVEVIDRRVKLKKTGKNYSACCPFHDEKTPSFSVNPDKQFYYCFGCGAGGNAVSFVMDYENLDFPQAVESLAASAGMSVIREEGSFKQSAAKKQRQRDLYSLMEQLAGYYQQALRQHPMREQAIGYLKNRGLSGEIAKTFGLGFAPPGWDNALKRFGQDEQGKQHLLQSGMLVENDQGRQYDRFRHRIMFPIRDQRGRVIAFGGRVLGDDKPKYLNSPETSIFHKGRELYGLYEVRKQNRSLEQILVVEGYMDVIALAQHGIHYAVATLGTATSETHLQRIYRLCHQVVFCFDGDNAGRKAAARALETSLPTLQDGRQVRFLFLPEGHDPDTLVREKGAQHLEHLILNAQPLEEYLFAHTSEGIDTDTMEGRALLSQRALPYLQRLPKGVYRQLMYNSLAERTGLSSAELQATLPEPPPAPQVDSQHSYQHQDAAPHEEDTSAQQDQRASPRKRKARPQQKIGDNLAQAAIALLLHQPTLARENLPSLPASLEGESVALLREIIELLKQNPSTPLLMGHWYDTAEGELLARLAAEERLIPEEGIGRQLHDVLARLIRQHQRQNLDEEIARLKAIPYQQLSADDKQSLLELMRAKGQLKNQ